MVIVVNGMILHDLSVYNDKLKGKDCDVCVYRVCPSMHTPCYGCYKITPKNKVKKTQFVRSEILMEYK